MAFTVLWGVLLPILSEAFTGTKVTVGPPFFNQVMVPIGLLLLFVTGVCPLIAWRRASLANLRKNFDRSRRAVAVVVLAVLLVLGVRQVYRSSASPSARLRARHRRSWSSSGARGCGTR